MTIYKAASRCAGHTAVPPSTTLACQKGFVFFHFFLFLEILRFFSALGSVLAGGADPHFHQCLVKAISPAPEFDLCEQKNPQTPWR